MLSNNNNNWVDQTWTDIIHYQKMTFFQIKLQLKKKNFSIKNFNIYFTLSLKEQIIDFFFRSIYNY